MQETHANLRLALSSLKQTGRIDESLLNDISKSISAKFEMIGYCVAYINKYCDEQVSKKIEDFKFKNSDGEDLEVSCFWGHINEDNLKSIFYCLISVSISLIDSLESLIYEAYLEEITEKFKERFPGKKLTENAFSFYRLCEAFQKTTPLDITVNDFIEQRKGLQRLISLRDNMIHSNITGILRVDAHDKNNYEVQSDWTPTGTDMALSKYSIFVLDESKKMIQIISNVLQEHPEDALG